jgi:hypothetical protein
VIDWGFAFAFAAFLGLGWLASIKWGGYTERATMCLLTCVWVGVVLSQWATGTSTPYMFYATLDLAGIVWLWQHQRRNWQWIPGGIFAIMLMCHLVYWGSVGASARPYLDIIALLAYAQVFSVMLASKARRDVRNGKGNLLADWALATDWLPRGRVNHQKDEGV